MTGGSATGRLEGRRVLVTGGARGLGRAIVLACARAGARVAFTYAKDEAAASTVLGELTELGSPGLAARVLADDETATEAFLAAMMERLGGIDGLVNNAGLSQNLPLPLLDAADWDRVVDTNLKGAYLTARAAMRRMLTRAAGTAEGRGSRGAGEGPRASIVNIGSLAGERMMEAPIHYAASKAGVRGLTEAMAKEGARHGIRVNCVAPGILEDGVARNVPESRLGPYLRHCALGRVGRFEEVAGLVVFLLSAQASYISGATVRIDGGIC